MMTLMRRYANYGAMDSEPMYHLEFLMKKTFPGWN